MGDSTTNNNEEIYEHTFATDVYALAWTVCIRLQGVCCTCQDAPATVSAGPALSPRRRQLCTGPRQPRGHYHTYGTAHEAHAVPSTTTTVDHTQRAFVQDTARSFTHPYPPTKLAFVPDPQGTRPDLLASTSDFLRLWHIHEDGVQLEKTLTTVRVTSIIMCMSATQHHPSTESQCRILCTTDVI